MDLNLNLHLVKDINDYKDLKLIKQIKKNLILLFVEILMLLLLKYVSEPTIITNTKKENRIKEKAKDILPLVNS